jgi:two-component sensor histidine kinase/ligand-binding sensor domain-containing protein
VNGFFKVMTLPRLLFFSFLIDVGFTSQGQGPSHEKQAAPSPDTHFDLMTVRDGLPYNTVTCMVKDKLGFMWIATLEGLSRYDGTSFITYKNNPRDSSTLLSNQVWSIAVDSKGNIWGATGLGAFCFNPVTGKFKNYLPNVHDSTTVSCDNFGCVFVDSHDNVYLGGWNELNIYYSEKKVFRHYFHVDNNPLSIVDIRVAAVCEDKNGRIWIGTYSGLELFDMQTGTFHFKKLPFFFDEHRGGPLVNRILEDDKGNLWITTWANGLIRYNTATEVGKIYRIEPGRQANGSTNVAVDLLHTNYAGEENKLWVATRSSGLYLFDMERETLTRFSETAPGNPHYVTLDIRKFFDDGAGNIFIATGAGLFKYSRTTQLFHTITLPINAEKCLSNVFCIYQDPADATGNTLLIGTWTCGGYRYNIGDNSLKQVSEISHTDDTLKQYSTVHNFYRDKKGNLWAFCQEGIYVQDAKTGKWKKLERKDPDENKLWSAMVCDYKEENDGTFWFSCNEGLMHYNPESGSSKRVRFNLNNETPDVSVSYFFCESPANVFWIVGARGTIIRYDAVSGRSEFFRHDPHNSKSFPVPNDLREIFADSQHRIWLATGKGLAMFHDNDSVPLYTYYHTTDGLPSENTRSVIEDKEGKIWCATLNGLSCFDTKRRVFRNYGLTEGLLFVDVWGAFSCSPLSGKIFMGFQSMMQYFDPLRISKSSYCGPVYLTGISVMGKEFNSRKSPSYLDTLKLSYRQNEITVSFAMVNYAEAALLKYEYYLEGLNEDWISLEKNHSVTLTNLNGGPYKLHVRGVNADGINSPDRALLTLIITPPFWKTNWFYLLCILIVAAAIVVYNRLRSRILRRQKKALEETVRNRTEQLRTEKERAEQLVSEKEMLIKEIHHRVKNNLEVISSLLELQSEGIIDVKAKAAVIEGKSRVQSIALIHHTLYGTDNVAAVEFKSFANNLYNQVESVFKQPGTEIEFKIDAAETLIPIVAAVPIGLILNELLTNSFKYAVSKEKVNVIRLELITGQPSALNKIIYYDNGPGMPEGYDISKSSSLGMKVIQLLTKQLGGTLHFYNDNGSTFEIPFKI